MKYLIYTFKSFHYEKECKRRNFFAYCLDRYFINFNLMSIMKTFGLTPNDYQNKYVKIVLDMDFIENCKDAISSIELNIESEYTFVYVNCDLSDKNEIFRLDKYSLDKIECDYHIYLTHNQIEFLFKHEIE